MIYCTDCYYKKICSMFKTHQDVKDDIKIQILSCSFYKQSQQSQYRNVDLDFNVRSAKIKAVQSNKTQTLPISVSMVKGTGMQFSVDDEDIS